MTYKIEVTEGAINVYSPKIGMYLMEDATMDQVRIALATEMEYEAKLKITKLLMTFPHGFLNMNDELIVNQAAMDVYDTWYKSIRQKIGFIDDYYRSIDEKIEEILQRPDY